MPTYTYTCKQHGTFDLVTRMSEHRHEQACPNCGELSEQCIDVVPSVVFKGKGWTRPAPFIPEKIRNMSEAELDSDLGLVRDPAPVVEATVAA